MSEGGRESATALSLPPPIPRQVLSQNGATMHVQQFDNHEQMLDYLRQAQAEAHNTLHPAQRAITHGTCWVRFVDLANRLIEFGRVATLEEVEAASLEAGSTAAEALDDVKAAEFALDRHYMTGMAHSRTNPDGEWGSTHKAHVWPIDGHLFLQAGRVNWQIELLPASGKINLEAAFRAMRGHVRGE